MRTRKDGAANIIPYGFSYGVTSPFITPQQIPILPSYLTTLPVNTAVYDEIEVEEEKISIPFHYNKSVYEGILKKDINAFDFSISDVLKYSKEKKYKPLIESLEKYSLMGKRRYTFEELTQDKFINLFERAVLNKINIAYVKNDNNKYITFNNVHESFFESVSVSDTSSMPSTNNNYMYKIVSYHSPNEKDISTNQLHLLYDVSYAIKFLLAYQDFKIKFPNIPILEFEKDIIIFENKSNEYHRYNVVLVMKKYSRDFKSVKNMIIDLQNMYSDRDADISQFSKKAKTLANGLKKLSKIFTQLYKNSYVFTDFTNGNICINPKTNDVLLSDIELEDILPVSLNTPQFALGGDTPSGYYFIRKKELTDTINSVS